MNSPIPGAAKGPDAALEADLMTLERRLASLIAHTRALRAANESLRRDLAATTARNHQLGQRVAEATRRLDALLARIGEPAG
jgi:hypothetical protein